jgi:hypothetical protein
VQKSKIWGPKYLILLGIVDPRKLIASGLVQVQEGGCLPQAPRFTLSRGGTITELIENVVVPFRVRQLSKPKALVSNEQSELVKAVPLS